jgi:hypothetical protein
MLPLLATTIMSDAAQSTATSVDIAQTLSRVNWASPTWDLFIVLFFLVTVFLYGMTMGRDRIIVILVSIYMALAVISNAPYLNQLRANVNLSDFFALKVSTFLGIFVLLFFLLSRSALLKTFGGMASGSWWQVFLFSIFHVGLLVSITLSFVPAEAVHNLAPITQSLFASDGGKFFWIVAPIMAMVLIKSE